MKIISVLSAPLALFLLSAASSLPRHQAYGALRFGMSAPTAAKTSSTITRANSGKMMVTASDVRSHFVTEGALRVARDTAYDKALQVNISYKVEPFLSEVSVYSVLKSEAEYDSFVKQVWETFQDIGDSKFQRKSPKGTFPTAETVRTQLNGAVTDTWEVDGIRIELSVGYYDPAQRPGAPAGPIRYDAALKATEINPPVTK